jgi:hypothetical protein
VDTTTSLSSYSARGTEGSNPAPSTGESKANPDFLDRGRRRPVSKASIFHLFRETLEPEQVVCCPTLSALRGTNIRSVRDGMAHRWGPAGGEPPPLEAGLF